MEDVAKALQVSRTTVSRALKNDPRISLETRSRVREMARRMGYRLNPLVSALMLQRAGRPTQAELGTIAYLTSVHSDSVVRHGLPRDLLRGASQRAEELGYRLERFLISPEMTFRRLCSVLQARGIIGVCISPILHERGHISMDWGSFSASAIGHSLAGPQLHRAAHNHFHGILSAIRNLRRMGYRRIGFCVDSAISSRVDDAWLAGFLVAKERFPRIHFSLLLERNLTHEKFFGWFGTFQPEVIISDNWGFELALRKLNLRVPEDVGFVTLARDAQAPHQSGIDQNSTLIARTAIDIIVGQIQRNERGVPTIPQTILIEGVWHAGETVRNIT